MIRFERDVWLQLNTQKDLPQEKIGTMPGVDQAGILADPSQSGALGQVSLQNRSGIGIDSVGNGIPDFALR